MKKQEKKNMKKIRRKKYEKNTKNKNKEKKLFKSLKYNDYFIWNVYADHYYMSNTTVLTNY